MAKNKTETPKSKNIVFTRKQILDMATLANHFTEVEMFTVEETYESGIGPTLKVKCTLFENPTTVDITDVENW